MDHARGYGAGRLSWRYAMHVIGANGRFLGKNDGTEKSDGGEKR
jgi:hypothetical protein